MSSQRPVSIAVVSVVAALLLAAAVGLEAAREHAFPSAEIDESALYLTSATAVRRLTTSLHALAADVYWIRTLQYYGSAKRRLATVASEPSPPPFLAVQSDYDQLYPLLDITTTLDPRFAVAYRFGAIFLAEAYPAGPGRPDLAIALLEKGIREQPDKWEYMEDAGFVHYWYRRDYRAAAAWFEKAGDLPNAPNWLKPLAAATLAQGGDRRSSRLMWTSILETSEQDWLKQSAQHRLLQLRALDDIDALQSVVDEYVKRTGDRPSAWPTLIAARAIRGIPVDPTGVPYQLGANGKVDVAPRSSLVPLPNEPLAASPSS